MTVVVELDRQSHYCCGGVLRRSERVVLTCRYPAAQSDAVISPDSRAPDFVADYVAINHSGRFPFLTCSGVVAGIVVVDRTGHRWEAGRVPSGRARRGFDDSDDGVVRAVLTGVAIGLAGSTIFVCLTSAIVEEVDATGWVM